MLNALLGWALSFSVLSAAVFWLNFQWQNDRYLVLINQRQNDARALMATMVHDLKRSNFQATMSNNSLGNMGLCPSAFCGLPEDFEMLNANMQTVIEPGDFTIMVGSSSRDIRLKKTVQLQ